MNNYKNALALKTLPETGAALKTNISFLNYFSPKIAAFAQKSKNLRKFADSRSGAQKLPWEDNPDLVKEYHILIDATDEYSGLAAIPRDKDKIKLLLFASDACSDTVAYSLGVALKPNKQTNNKTEEESKVEVRLASHFSKNWTII